MIKIGWATREFTPERPAMLQGQMHVRIARQARDPLTLTACAFEDAQSGSGAILVSLDIAYITPDLLNRIRKAARKIMPGIHARGIILNATHTHTSLVFDNDFYPMPDEVVMTPDECKDLIVVKAVEAVVDAWQNRSPHQIGRAFGHAVVGHNRYAVYQNGTAHMYGSSNRPDFVRIGGYEDHSLDMVFTWSPDGRLTGIILSIPCPSQVEENLTEFSADYWHDVRQELCRRLGRDLKVLTVCGPAGDQSPHFIVYAKQEEEMRRRRGLSERQEIALRVATAVERALACTIPMPDGQAVFKHTLRPLDLTALKITREHADWAKASLDTCRKGGMPEDGWYPMSLKQVLAQWRKRTVNPPFPMELHVMRIGDTAFATNPFELFLDYGIQIKARSTASQTMLMQLTGRGMYLPTAQALGFGGYGANPVVAKVGPEGGAELVEATLEAIRKLFPG